MVKYTHIKQRGKGHYAETFMIHATVRELKNAYNNHLKMYSAMQNPQPRTSAQYLEYSRSLLLVYAVECGLKCLILKKYGLASTKSLLDRDDCKKLEDDGHNLIKLLEIVGFSDNSRNRAFHLPPLVVKQQTLNARFKKYVDIEVYSSNYHEVLRYGVGISNASTYNVIISKLLFITEWIEKRIYLR